MARFFDYDIAAFDGQPFDMSWSDAGVLAVASSNNNVYLYHEEGEELENGRISRDVPCMKVAWQPRGRMLATGWQDGVIGLWSTGEQASRENTSVHRCPISFLKWNARGTRLISGDENGVVGVWKSDARGQLSRIAEYHRTGKLTHCEFFTMPSAPGQLDALSQLSPSFFVASETGTVSYCDDMGSCSDVQSLNSPIDVLLFFPERCRLLIITRSLLMTQLQVADDGRVTPLMKVKMASAGSIQGATWAGPGLLATASNENLIRFVDLEEQHQHYVLSLSTAGPAIERGDKALTLAFNPRRRTLAVSTREGKIAMWRHNANAPVAEDGSPADRWEPLPVVVMRGRCDLLQWGPGRNLLAAAMHSDVSILNETVLHRCMSGGVAVTQTRDDQFVVESRVALHSQAVPVNTNIRVKGMAAGGGNVAVWNGKRVEVYDVADPSNVAQLSSFQTTATAMALRHDSLYQAEGALVQVCNVQGVVKTSISFSEAEGVPEHLDINGSYMAVATSNGLVRLYDLSRREPKVVGGGGARFVDPETQAPLGAIRSVRANCDGTRISLLVDSVQGAMAVRHPDSRLFVCHVDMGTFSSHDFGAHRAPVEHYWDPNEPKLLACEVQRSGGSSAGAAAAAAPASASEGKQAEGAAASSSSSSGGSEVATLFVTPDNEILVSDSFSREANWAALLGISVPQLFFASTPQEDGTGGPAFPRLLTRVMRDFVGLEDVDEATRAALLDFSYYLTVGNMDEAYKAVKLVRSPGVWENMAHMCVKTKRLDVAEVCLGNMGHARGARAVREARNEPEPDAVIAMVAIQLGLLDDAARLYRECGRYDLLNRLYQASGYWERALEVASNKDRIHLRHTHHEYARYLESLGETQNAIYNYERAKTHRTEVPRMLFDPEDPGPLESYIQQTEDPQLCRWWAQYCESESMFERATEFYEAARDYLALVRVLCFSDQFSEAIDVVMRSQDKAAAYHLARQLEGTEQIQEAINFFSQAGRYNHAIRLAKEHGLDSELMSFALQSPPHLMLEVAEYFEQKQEFEKAVQLYQKANNVPKALALCFRAQLFDVLRNISDDLGEDTSPEILARCAAFFIEHQQFEKAVHLLVTARRFDEALDLAMEHKIRISEEMAERMTPEKNTEDKAAEAARIELLLKIARCCKKQASYHLAAKKFTQAGEKQKAMKCLIKSGDTEKITFFATVSRSRDIYVLAANYLQSLDWHSDPDVMKSIIQFYTKAKAYSQLSSFYEACATVEVDEYRDYEKALGALKEAVKYMIKARKPEDSVEMMQLQQRVRLVERFSQARRCAKSDPNEMVRICQELLEDPDVSQAIRVGDCLALMVEYQYGAENFREAHRLIEQMRDRRIQLDMYLTDAILQRTYKAVGEQAPRQANAPAEDEVGEEIGEDLED